MKNWLFHEVAVEKKFLQIDPTMKKTHKLPGPAEVSYKVGGSTAGAKEDQMMGRRCFQPWGFQ